MVIQKMTVKTLVPCGNLLSILVVPIQGPLPEVSINMAKNLA